MYLTILKTIKENCKQKKTGISIFFLTEQTLSRVEMTFGDI